MLRASEGAAANFQQSSWSLPTQHSQQVQQGLLSIEVVSKFVLVVAVVQSALSCPVELNMYQKLYCLVGIHGLS